MPINSPIANFTEVLKRVKIDAERYEDLLRNNEAQTRLTLIDPILRGLGWELSNPAMIRVELRFEDTRLDYGLLAPTGETRYVIEAKKLGTELGHPNNYNLVIRYAFTNNISHVALTDGILWHFYDNFLPGRTIPIIFDFRSGPIEDIALELINRLDAAQFGYCVSGELHQGLTVEQITRRDLVQDEPAPNEDFIPFEQLPLNLTGHRPPTALRLPDMTVIPTKHWSDVLYETSKYVLDRATNLQLPLNDRSNRTVNLICLTEPIGSNKQYQFRGRTIFINLNYSSKNCIKNSIYIIEKLPANLRQNSPALKFN